LGAACLAALGAGIFESRGEVAKAWALDKRWTPKIGESERHARLAQWRRFVESSRALYAAMRVPE
ncbi:MAG: hypothetical protein WDA16_02130, partial [Candidatus Thermoplasmatota archaeon]